MSMTLVMLAVKRSSCSATLKIEDREYPRRR